MSYSCQMEPEKTPEGPEQGLRTSQQVTRVKRTQRETQFKPGVSGNPGGMSRKRTVTREVERILLSERNAEAKILARAIIEKAKADPSVLKILLDRVEGPIEQRVHQTGDTGPQFVVRIVDGAAREEPLEIDAVEIDAVRLELDEINAGDEQRLDP